ncbi:hypothetical protein Cgig2_023233 [Carnegiea gigantea]|uniref:Uncharacterized protein n=1 Tax=Carnegiea gigantea TaxID=171969 RepID=A0A9Q1GPX2_9CARY|nr:hypothetical protein Cgig2_023233 [Carnegiea gigantea]
MHMTRKMRGQRKKKDFPRNPQKKGPLKVKSYKNAPSKPKKKALTDRHSKAAVEKVHIFDEKLSNSADLEENDQTYECKEVNNDEGMAEGKEEATIHQIIKATRKRNKPSLKYESDHGIEEKHVQSNAGTTLVVAKTTILTHDLLMVQLEFAKLQLKQQPNEDDGVPSFSPILALHEPDSEAQILATTSVADTSVSLEEEDHHENVPLD